MENYFIITRVEIATGKETIYDGTEEDVKAITKGYKLNETFGYYERKNGKYIFFVVEE